MTYYKEEQESCYDSQNVIEQKNEVVAEGFEINSISEQTLSVETDAFQEGTFVYLDDNHHQIQTIFVVESDQVINSDIVSSVFEMQTEPQSSSGGLGVEENSDTQELETRIAHVESEHNHCQPMCSVSEIVAASDVTHSIGPDSQEMLTEKTGTKLQPGVYPCELCSATFTTPSNYRRHKLVHAIDIKVSEILMFVLQGFHI